MGADGSNSNKKKVVDGDDPGDLTQGAMIHEVDHWLGTCWERRCATACCTILTLARKHVSYKYVEKIVGKHGFCESFNTCTRACFQEVYKWVDGRLDGAAYGVLSPEAWGELLVSVCWKKWR